MQNRVHVPAAAARTTQSVSRAACSCHPRCTSWKCGPEVRNSVQVFCGALEEGVTSVELEPMSGALGSVGFHENGLASL